MFNRCSLCASLAARCCDHAQQRSGVWRHVTPPSLPPAGASSSAAASSSVCRTQGAELRESCGARSHTDTHRHGAAGRAPQVHLARVHGSGRGQEREGVQVPAEGKEQAAGSVCLVSPGSEPLPPLLLRRGNRKHGEWRKFIFWMRKILQKNDTCAPPHLAHLFLSLDGSRRTTRLREISEKNKPKKKKLQSGRFDGECKVNLKVSDYNNLPVLT